MVNFTHNSSKRKRKTHSLNELDEQLARGIKFTVLGIIVCVFCIQIVTHSNDTASLDPDTAAENQHHQSLNPKFICQWTPDSHEECNQLLAQRLPPQIVSTNALKRKGDHPGPRRQRWLFFGDSTMKRQFTASNLDRHLVGEPIHFIKKGRFGKVDPCWTSIDCEERRAERCDMAKVYGFEPVKNWQPPKFFPNFEGPTHYGLDHPDCSDCGGCGTNFLHCSVNLSADQNDMKKCDQSKLTYGGFMKVEFAKDVELQTVHFGTTQENTALYLHQHFNQPELVKEWGKPICVMLTGFHDMILLLKTDHFDVHRFAENVEWYLNVMRPQCGHIIWITNTAPSLDNRRNWPQTVEVVKDWNEGVKKLIEQNVDLQQMTTIVDVYSSSLEIKNKDHIHLVDKWYNDLGHFFSALVTERPVDEI